MSKLFYLLSAFLLCFCNPIYSENFQSDIHSGYDLSSYERPEAIDPGIWFELQSYLLPKTHPIKPALDKLFSKRVTLNDETLKQAGFLTPHRRPSSHIVVSKHPDLKGYLVKLYTDDFPHFEEWRYLLGRILGAKFTKAAIKELGHETFFKVPKKWIYPLPDVPVPYGYHRKYFILVVEDMKLLKSHQNYKSWEGPTMTPRRLKAYYEIIANVGLSDAIYPFNVPFTKDGKQAFIDTQDFHRWPIKFEKLTPYLSPKMQEYWHELTQ